MIDETGVIRSNLVSQEVEIIARATSDARRYGSFAGRENVSSRPKPLLNLIPEVLCELVLVDFLVDTCAV